MFHSSMPDHLRALPSALRRHLIERFLRQPQGCPIPVRWSRAEDEVGVVSVVVGDDEEGFPIRFVRVGNDLYRAA